MKAGKPEISIILPCRNEEQALPFCLEQIKEAIKKNNLHAEIIVSDSSIDNSPKIAKREKVILLKHNKEGYGMAYLEAFKIAKRKYIFMADADGTYDFNEIPNFINQLKNGFDMAIGNRFAGKMQPDAMTFSHRYIGNPILSFVLRLFFKTKIKDSQCGMRAIKKSALEKLNLQTGGMEFASEMIIKALRANLKIRELPIDYYCRKGKSKMKSFRDAYKHLRFMLLYSPLFLFFIPGLILIFTGTISVAFKYFSIFLSSLMVITGYQLIIFSGFAKIYSITHLKEKSRLFEKLFKYITIERASIFGVLFFIAAFFSKNPVVTLTLLVIGVQTIFSSFIFSILGIKEK